MTEPEKWVDKNNQFFGQVEKYCKKKPGKPVDVVSFLLWEARKMAVMDEKGKSAELVDLIGAIHAALKKRFAQIEGRVTL